MSNVQKIPTTNGRPVMRVRFFVDIDECENDHRTLIWPIPHPYWCSGETDNDYILVAYVESEEQLYSQWPEAKNVEVLEQGLLEYSFGDRFGKPEWIPVEYYRMPAETYWHYNVPMGYHKNSVGDVAEGCPVDHIKTTQPSSAEGWVNQFLPRKEFNVVEEETWKTIAGQDKEQFFLTASKMHLELSKDFYLLSQGKIDSVPQSPSNYLPEIELVTADNVEVERVRLGKLLGFDQLSD